MRLLSQSLNEGGIDEGVNHRNAFIRQVAILLLRELGLQPDDNMSGPWCNSVRPVIESNGVVRRTTKGLRIFEGNTFIVLRPLETLFADES